MPRNPESQSVAGSNLELCLYITRFCLRGLFLNIRLPLAYTATRRIAAMWVATLVRGWSLSSGSALCRLQFPRIVQLLVPELP